VNEPRTCPLCATALGADGPCPRCLMEHAAGGPTPTPVLEPAPSPLELAPHFPKYELQVLVGQGGAGAVYRARHVKLDRLVAIKLLRAELSRDPEFAERFEREARALARLDHPGIVRVHDFGEAAGSYFLAMEYVEGASLRDLLGDGRLTAKDVLAFIPQICDALQYAHDQGIVHRDIKPENLLVDLQGRVRIADFGLAKLVAGDDSAAPVTLTRQVLGTPHYMAPEQVSGRGVVDHRADIYSLGVVFYELLTGDLPIGRFGPPSQTDAANRPLDPVVMRSLENDPERRYQRADDVKDGIDAGWTAEEEPPPPSPPMPAANPAMPPATPAMPRAGHELGWMDGALFALVLAACFMPWFTYGDEVFGGWTTSVTLLGVSVPSWSVLISAGGVVLLRASRRAGATVPDWCDPAVACCGYLLPTLTILGVAVSEPVQLGRSPRRLMGELEIGSGALLAWIALGAWVLQTMLPWGITFLGHVRARRAAEVIERRDRRRRNLRRRFRDRRQPAREDKPPASR
jgi:tRNA A-37 threonylcarbamoyl transferase component Bud32